MRLTSGIAFAHGIVVFLFVLQSGIAMAEQEKPSLDELNKVIASLDASYTGGSIQSLAQAEKALADADQAKTVLQKWYVQSEIDCHEKFFVNACLNGIKLIQRSKGDILQRITVEAKALQRKRHIEELDEKLKEKLKE